MESGMEIRKLILQNFRNYPKKVFEFSPQTTLIVGPNASGKTNILEAVYGLAIGKSFRAEKEDEVIGQISQIGQIRGTMKENDLEIIWDGRSFFRKIYKVNGVGKRQQDFVGQFRAVLFCPQDIEIITDSPSIRRKYLDLVLTQIFKDYRVAVRIYEKALRQRNRLLWQIREKRLAVRGEQLEYWNNLLITNGKIIHERRREYLGFLGSLVRLPARQGGLGIEYEHSIISTERLEKYAAEEMAAATTLVGPHRDDFFVKIQETNSKKQRDVKHYGSRGEQRLAIFDIKLGELAYIEKVTGEKPVLLLDDIFSELDHANRHKILEIIPKQQTIMTTTDLHLVEKARLKDFTLLNLP
jgi:DNA replication and repair protein RecF